MKKVLRLFLLILLIKFNIIINYDAKSQTLNSEISDKKYYIDNSDLYNTTLPISETEKKLPETINKKIYYYPETYYNPHQQYYGQNFKNRDKLSKTPIKTTYSAENPDVKITQYKEIINNSSNTRTAGNYIGIDFINTQLQYREYNYYNQNPETLIGTTARPLIYSSFGNKNGFGLKYIYAINYKGLFLAPEIFYEYNNIKKSYYPNNDTDTDKRLANLYGYKYMKIDYRYGAKLNLGYDINPDFAPYIFAGVARTKHSNLSSIYLKEEADAVTQASGQYPLQTFKATTLVPFYGFGGKIKLSPRFYLNAEYMVSEFITKTGSKKFTTYENTKLKNKKRPDLVDIEANIRIFKIGITYNF